MRTAVTGSRDWKDKQFVYDSLDHCHSQNPITELTTGKCKTGVDVFAEQWAKDRGVPFGDGYPANWTKYGRAAGPIRNREMLDDFKPAQLVVFPGNRGTRDCEKAARERNITIIKYGWG